jgi:hypothetical protein
LIYRNEAELANVTSGIPAAQIAAQQTFSDPYKTVVFLEVEKQ